MTTQTKDDCGGHLVSAGEVQRRLNICFSTLVNWRKKKLIKCVPLPSGHFRYPESEITRLLNKKAPAPEDSCNREQEPTTPEDTPR